MIKVNGLSKQFGDLTAVDSLSFEVAQGEIFGIVGPDGAGKSTLMRLMAGILGIKNGTVVINGLNVQKNPYKVKENLAYMPQRFGLYDDLTVEENIFFFGRLFGVSGKDILRRSERLYDFSQLGPFKKRLAGNLSGGMKQKLGLACCLIHSPELILLDEPTNGVDPVSRREFWRILYDLLADGVTIVVSTAYLDEAERCNRVALMHEGSFMLTGTPSDIKNSMKRIMVEIETDDIWEAEAALKNYEHYRNVIREGNALRLFVDNYKKDSGKISKYLSAKKVKVISIREKSPSLENCFMEIISTGGAE
ncbi:MAG: ABC transporter ATP-binding protein [Spirochaetes bacterium]|nr:ABC transporter ATP-binding protein [Spirochaetota bacterium]